MRYQGMPNYLTPLNINDGHKAQNTLNHKNHYFTLDEALDFVGDGSTYQKTVITFLAIGWAIFSFLVMGFPFLFVQPNFICYGEMDEEGNIMKYPCDHDQACKLGLGRYEVDEVNSLHSISYEFEFYCERVHLIGFCGTIFFIGAFISGFFFPYISERRGRKYALNFSITTGGLAIFFAGFSPNVFMLFLLMLIAGFGLFGFETLSLVYVSEISGERFRNFAPIILAGAWAAGQFFLAPLVYMESNWRFILSGIIGVPFLINLFFIQTNLFETPRYLASKGRYPEARMVLDAMAHINRRPKIQCKLVGEMNDNYRVQRTQTDYAKQLANTFNYFDLFKFESLKKNTLFLLVVWVFRYFAYYGINFSLTSFGGEIFTNFTLTSFAEILACIAAFGVKLKMGRITSLTFTTFLVVFSSLFVVFFSIPGNCYGSEENCYQKSFSVLLAVLVKFGIALFSNILITYTSEIYPTVVRSLGYGLAMTTGRLGLIFMPIIVSIMQGSNINPLVFFGFLGIFAAFGLLQLPETMGQPLEDQIKELKRQNPTEEEGYGEYKNPNYEY